VLVSPLPREALRSALGWTAWAALPGQPRSSQPFMLKSVYDLLLLFFLIPTTYDLLPSSYTSATTVAEKHCWIWAMLSRSRPSLGWLS